MQGPDEAARQCTRAASAMGSGKGLVQIHVDHIKAHITGFDLAEDRIEVCAVVVEESAGIVNEVRDLQDLALENADD